MAQHLENGIKLFSGSFKESDDSMAVLCVLFIVQEDGPFGNMSHDGAIESQGIIDELGECSAMKDKPKFIMLHTLRCAHNREHKLYKESMQTSPDMLICYSSASGKHYTSYRLLC